MARDIASVGIVGNYPNGGYPAQAYFGVMGHNVRGMGSPAGASARSVSDISPSSSSDPFALGTSDIAVLGTIAALVLGGYLLWHFTY